MPPTPSDTPAVRAADEVLVRFAAPEIVEHSRRCAEWVGLLSAIEGVEPDDPELLTVAALLHDVGLAEQFDAVIPAYEDAGGSVAWTLAAGAGWSPARRDRLREVIIRHNWPSVPVSDPDGHLLERATAVDVRGIGADALDPGDVARVLARHPRGEFGVVFRELLRDQAARKPSSAAERILSGGGPAIPHPHDHA